MEGARVVRLAGRDYRVRIERPAPGVLHACVESDGGPELVLSVGVQRDGRVLLGSRPVEAALRRGRDGGLVLQAHGVTWPVDILPEAAAELARPATGGATSSRPVSVRTPMPGRVLAVEATEGTRVDPGMPLFIIEAMKMENEIRAPAGGVVRALAVGAGDAVETDQELCVLEPLGGGA